MPPLEERKANLANLLSGTNCNSGNRLARRADEQKAARRFPCQRFRSNTPAEHKQQISVAPINWKSNAA
jgi:hypothetical protein